MFEPLVSAIAAGNVALMKPSETSPSSSAVIRKIVEKGLDKRFFRCLEGGPNIGSYLTTLRFDLIAFTGGSSIAKHVAKAAA